MSVAARHLARPPYRCSGPHLGQTWSWIVYNDVTRRVAKLEVYSSSEECGAKAEVPLGRHVSHCRGSAWFVCSRRYHAEWRGRRLALRSWKKAVWTITHGLALECLIW